MKAIFSLAIAGAAAIIPLQGALACPPLPPGTQPPTAEQFLARSMPNVSDIVYGVVTRERGPGEPARFKIIHVYRGTLHKGDIVEAIPGWGFPEPVCVGMMSPAYPKPPGTYGVAAFSRDRKMLNFVSPENVRIMIDKGWIKSARTR